ncbi:unnamed protein product [Clonostachys rosea f. rosea IK726]|uniref:Uncharacterized protein n=2 Tax=Bionectria ochroleuca TaxID=29856 RepID=A0A0B7K795_BIOOC|nr:unnamed protein product [Clonostachys rosea f. rosea IK726]
MKKGSKKHGEGSSSRISDPRFANFQTDPRFRLPSKKKTKTTLDKRFAGMLKDEEFTATARVDRYGRKLKSDSKKKALERLYQPEEDENKDDEDGEGDKDGLEVDDDEVVQRELRKAHEKFDPARGGGFSSSESDSDSDSDDDDEDEDEDDEAGGATVSNSGDMQRFQDQRAEVESGEVTKRIAIVNLDWDHIKSTDLMALFSSFLPGESGKIEKISIYPSEFGKERMQQEEVEGPPKALFKDSDKRDSESDESDDDDDSDLSEDEKIKKELMQEGDDADFDSDALRSYQLDRLRYYYAVMVCSSLQAAKKIYESTDGTEFQSSSNFLDLRFVPDDVTFDDEPRDECDKVPESYKPVEFVTNALQSSKVKLTWDMHPEETSRKEALDRAFTGSRSDLQDNDLRAYLASDSEGEDEEEEDADAGEEEKDAPKLSKKELARKKMREALGLSEEPTAKESKHGPVGGMQITFTPALTDTKKKQKKAGEEETTLEKYVRKERERKEQKRQKAKARRGGQDSDAESEDEGAPAQADEGEEEEEEEDLGFDDPFFTTDEPAVAPSKTSIRKEERRKKREAREAADAESAAQKAHLTKVMAEDADENQASHLDHFDMNDILRAEKQKKKKGKKGKKDLASGNLQEDFSMDVGDDRFKAVFEDHEFAIDPSNPRFKGSEGMNQLLEEGRKKRRGDNDDEPRRSKKAKKGRR